MYTVKAKIYNGYRCPCCYSEWDYDFVKENFTEVLEIINPYEGEPQWLDGGIKEAEVICHFPDSAKYKTTWYKKTWDLNKPRGNSYKMTYWYERSIDSDGYYASERLEKYEGVPCFGDEYKCDDTGILRLVKRKEDE